MKVGHMVLRNFADEIIALTDDYDKLKAENAELRAGQGRWPDEARESSDHWLTTEAAKDATEPQAYRDGYIAGRTVTAEQVEAAAEALWNRSPFAEALEVGWDEWSRQNPDAAGLWEDDARFTLTAAGLLIEGDDHE